MTSYTVLTGDCLTLLRGLPDASVHCCVTSPPYFGLRSYLPSDHPDKALEIGLEETPDAYVARMVEVFREVRRVLRDDGTLFLNLGDSYSGAGVRRATACDTSGKALAGYQASDCLCGSLCDACRKAYRLGISRNGALHVPTPAPSSAASTHAHKGSQPDRLPMSGLTHLDARNADAIHDPAPAFVHEAVQPRDALVSMPPVSSQPPPAERRLWGQTSECLSCGCSLQDCVLASAHTAECICGTAAPASGLGNSGMGASGLAYPHLTTQSLKPKDLIGIPWRVAFALQADGWYLRQDIIWHKPNPMPESVTDRCTKAHEYVFLLSKSARYFYDADAIKEPAIYADSKRGSATKHDLAGDRKRAGSGMAPSFRAITETRNRRSVWTISTKPYSGAHFATFPPDLIEPCILAGCPVGGTVLDPFGGSGTTAGVALAHGRNAILCELNPDSVALMADRVRAIAGDTADMFMRAAE